MQKITLAALMAIFLCGCTTQYVGEVTDESLQSARLKSKVLVERSADWVIHDSNHVYLAEPQDIESQKRVRHLQQLASALDGALQRAFPFYSRQVSSQTLDESLFAAKTIRADLLLWPQLISTENRLNTTEELAEGQSLNPDKRYGTDRAVFKISIYEVRSSKLVDTVFISSRGRMFAGNDSIPADLFEEAALKFVDMLVGKPLKN